MESPNCFETDSKTDDDVWRLVREPHKFLKFVGVPAPRQLWRLPNESGNVNDAPLLEGLASTIIAHKTPKQEQKNSAQIQMSIIPYSHFQYSFHFFFFKKKNYIKFIN